METRQEQLDALVRIRQHLQAARVFAEAANLREWHDTILSTALARADREIETLREQLDPRNRKS